MESQYDERSGEIGAGFYVERRKFFTMPLDALYQKIILEHFRNPRNFGKLTGPVSSARHENPSCGDQLDLQISLDAQHIQDIKFYGHGCALSQASASMMTELVRGKTVVEAREASASFLQMLAGEGEIKVELGDLTMLAGVKQFPARVQCAVLAWKALESCLEQAGFKEK